MVVITPNRVGHTLRRVLPLLCTVLLVFALRVSAQEPCKASERSSVQSVGANQLVDLGKVKRRNVSGTVYLVDGTAARSAIIDVFRADNTREEKRIGSYRVSGDGVFCLSDLPDGDYQLRFGTAQGGFQQSLLHVQKRRSGSSKPLRITLELGT